MQQQINFRFNTIKIYIKFNLFLILSLNCAKNSQYNHVPNSPGKPLFTSRTHFQLVKFTLVNTVNYVMNLHIGNQCCSTN